jgi:hypothetical protein
VGETSTMHANLTHDKQERGEVTALPGHVGALKQGGMDQALPHQNIRIDNGLQLVLETKVGQVNCCDSDGDPRDCNGGKAGEHFVLVGHLGHTRLTARA